MLLIYTLNVLNFTKRDCQILIKIFHYKILRKFLDFLLFPRNQWVRNYMSRPGTYIRILRLILSCSIITTSESLLNFLKLNFQGQFFILVNLSLKQIILIIHASKKLILVRDQKYKNFCHTLNWNYFSVQEMIVSLLTTIGLVN